mmetsp:Transcript_18642/g.43587  ORF Transcript_18642/g.43587 Transcript_18642/m.43587 type:complete len:100 (-) Transcript_18642:175-474(-)
MHMHAPLCHVQPYAPATDLQCHSSYGWPLFDTQVLPFLGGTTSPDVVLVVPVVVVVVVVVAAAVVVVSGDVSGGQHQCDDLAYQPWLAQVHLPFSQRQP